MLPSDNNEPTPGLPEAVDPAAANGLAWALDEHEAALRRPDPLKALDTLANSAPEERNTPSGQDEKGPEKAPPSGILETPESGTAVTAPEAAPPPGKAKKKVKAGKRVRKALKALQASESEENEKDRMPNEKTKTPKPLTGQVAEPADAALSPFLSWLRTLPGSEYVHPYEEEGMSDLLDGSHQSVASETLADLLAVQGYTERAVAMYEALMRKFPEKSSFFAAKIKALQ